MEKPDGKKPLGSPRRRWENNTKMYLQEVEWGTGWIDLAQEKEMLWAVVNAVINLRGL